MKVFRRLTSKRAKKYTNLNEKDIDTIIEATSLIAIWCDKFLITNKNAYVTAKKLEKMIHTKKVLPEVFFLMNSFNIKPPGSGRPSCATPATMTATARRG